MRILLSNTFGFILSIFTGGTLAVAIAEATKAQEEFILAFAALAFIASVGAIAFTIARFRADPARRVRNAGVGVSLLFALLIAALMGVSFYASRSMAMTRGDAVVIGGIAGPGFLAIFTQWLFAWWRVRAHEDDEFERA